MYRDFIRTFVVTENDEDIPVTVEFRAYYYLDLVLGRRRYVLSEVELTHVDPPRYENWVRDKKMDNLVEVAEYENPNEDTEW